MHWNDNILAIFRLQILILVQFNPYTLQYSIVFCNKEVALFGTKSCFLTQLKSGYQTCFHPPKMGGAWNPCAEKGNAGVGAWLLWWCTTLGVVKWKNVNLLICWLGWWLQRLWQGLWNKNWVHFRQPK